MDPQEVAGSNVRWVKYTQVKCSSQTLQLKEALGKKRVSQMFCSSKRPNTLLDVAITLLRALLIIFSSLGGGIERKMLENVG